MAGRRPKPNHLHLVQGTARADRHSLNAAPTARRELPSPPAHLTDAARVTWGRMTALLDGMGVLTNADAMALERLCETYHEILSLTADIREHGRTYAAEKVDGGTMMRARPEVAMLADADRRFKSYLVEFGLTPAARTKVRVPDAPEQNAADRFFG